MTSVTAPNTTAIDDAVQAFKIGVMRSADDSIDLRYGVYKRGTAEPSQYVVFLNGRSEWIEKYAYVAADLGLPADSGFLTWDHRGQGASGGARAYVDDYATYASDARQIISKVVGNKPYVLLAHSMGCLVGLYAALTGAIAPRAMVLSSPLLGLPNKPVPRPLAKPISRLLSTVGLGPVSSGAGGFESAPFENNILTHNVDLYRRMVATPYRIPGATFAWVSASFKAVDVCFDPARLSKLNTPTLVMVAGQEQVVDPNGGRNWVRTASQHAKAELHLSVFPGAKHELFSEAPPYYDDAVKTAKAWLKPHLSDW